jgi:D-alanyl-D-alanine carboxypeptidase (penicillin-binding protein 5/6)
MLIVTGAFTFAAQAQEQDVPVNSEASLDLSLRTAALTQPVTTADNSAMETPASHMLLVDYDTGTILASKAPDARMYPSSMTKIMTLYMIFDRMKKGELTLANQFTVSEKAWRMQGSKMFVPLGEQVGLEDIIRGIAIQSGNDACIVIAEGIAGSEQAFAGQMNDTAKKIGMTGSNFVDASGWPHPEHVTTPRDLAVLGTALIRDFPEYYHYLAEREYSYNGIRQFNRNLLLGNAALKVDGIKTGHTDAAGYGIVLSAVDPATKRRLILVLNGLESEAARAQEGERLLQWGFRSFDNAVAFKAGNGIVNAPVWMGGVKELPLGVASDVKLTLPKTAAANVKASVSYQTPLIAPVKAGQEVGKLTLTFADNTTSEFPLVATADVESLGFFGRIGRVLGM